MNEKSVKSELPKQKKTLSLKKRILKKIKANFVAGVFALTPVAASIFVLVTIFNLTDKWMRGFLERFFNKSIYGVGMLVSFLIILSIGALVRNYIGRRIFYQLIEKFFMQVPIARTVYSSVKQISQAVVNQRRMLFNEVVFLEYPRKGIYSMGFITSKNNVVANRTLKEEFISVFVPTTPNPTSGFFVLVQRKDLISIPNFTVEDGIKAVLSAGMIMPEEKNTLNIEDPEFFDYNDNDTETEDTEEKAPL